MFCHPVKPSSFLVSAGLSVIQFWKERKEIEKRRIGWMANIFVGAQEYFIRHASLASEATRRPLIQFRSFGAGCRCYGRREGKGREGTLAVVRSSIDGGGSRSYCRSQTGGMQAPKSRRCKKWVPFLRCTLRQSDVDVRRTFKPLVACAPTGNRKSPRMLRHVEGGWRGVALRTRRKKGCLFVQNLLLPR